MPRLTDAERAARKQRRRAKRQRTWATIRKAIRKLVDVAELMFPDSGSGSIRHKWVTAAAKHIKTPAGDRIEAALLNGLIELAVEAL